MTYDELLAILARTGIPWAYHHWDKPPVLPWGVYLSDGDDSFFADDRTYFLSSGIRLEVYSLTRDPALDQAAGQGGDRSGCVFRTALGEFLLCPDRLPGDGGGVAGAKGGYAVAHIWREHLSLLRLQRPLPAGGEAGLVRGALGGDRVGHSSGAGMQEKIRGCFL